MKVRVGRIATGTIIQFILNHLYSVELLVQTMETRHNRADVTENPLVGSDMTQLKKLCYVYYLGNFMYVRR